MLIRRCYDGGTCANEDLIEELTELLRLAVSALNHYKDGYTWRHFATDVLEEIERRNLNLDELKEIR